jgi:hypothetical protein
VISRPSERRRPQAYFQYGEDDAVRSPRKRSAYDVLGGFNG